MIKAEACGPYGWVWMSRGWGGRSRRGGRPWWAEVMDEQPPRAERGGIRYLVLEAIADQPRHGYEIIQHIEQRAGGSYRPSPGVIYPTLQLLEELGHAALVEQEGRKVYRITEAGLRDLEENRRTVSDFYERFDEEPWESYAEDFGDLARGLARLVRAFKRGARRGRLSPDAMRAIRNALDEAVRKIEDALDGKTR